MSRLDWKEHTRGHWEADHCGMSLHVFKSLNGSCWSVYDQVIEIDGRGAMMPFEKAQASAVAAADRWSGNAHFTAVRETFRVLDARGQAPDDNAPLEVTVRRVMDYLDRVTAERDALVAELSALKKLAAPKKRVRNPEAQCRNCPYYSGFFKEHGYGVCCKDPGTDENTPKMLEGGFCGQHPDFWKEEACDTK